MMEPDAVLRVGGEDRWLAGMPSARQYPPKRMKKLSANATEGEVTEFIEACKIVEDEPADTLRKLTRAFALHVKKHGQITHPIRFAPLERAKK